MTAPAVVQALVCPKCGGAIWDNRVGKTNPKQPDFKCQNKECGWVQWPPKKEAAKVVLASPPASFANKPDADLPPLLRDAEAQDNAALAAKVGVDLTKFSKDLALYTALTEFVADKIAPIYAGLGIGMSPESAVAAVATLYIQAKRGQ